tara:strand:- start:13966 stop:14352 length:387 start_codon:yes stop_codon:yes gene_type:complete
MPSIENKQPCEVEEKDIKNSQERTANISYLDRISFNVKIRDLDHELPPGLEWNNFYSIYRPYQDDIIILGALCNNKLYLKPKYKKLSVEFEDMFNFKQMCQDYDENRIVYTAANSKVTKTWILAFPEK